MYGSHIKFGIISIVVIAIAYLAFNRQQDATLVQANTLLQTDRIDLERAKIAQEKASLHRNAEFWFYTKVGIPISLALIAFGVTCAYIHVQHKKASVHTFQLGKHNTIVVHTKDLSMAAPIAMQLTYNQQLAADTKTNEKANVRQHELNDMLVDQFRALAGRRGFVNTNTPPDMKAIEAPAVIVPTTDVPTCAQLLQRGELAPGQDMILAYEATGTARQGSMKDILSAAIAGESGSGKTGTMLFLIGSGILCEQIHFYGMCPHYPHPKSLGYKTKALWKEHEYMHMATDYKKDMVTMCLTIEQIIDNRLKQIDTDTTPVVMVIDELAFLNKTSLKGQLAHTMERISTEGRKCDVSMLASSQTWLASRTGENSAVRDTLTSAYVHAIKPKQVNLLLQDKEQTALVKKYIKCPGDVLFCPVMDEAVVCKMPYTTERDIATIAAILQKQDFTPTFPKLSVNRLSIAFEQKIAIGTSQQQIVDPGGSHALPLPKSENMISVLNQLFEESKASNPQILKTVWQESVAAQVGISISLLRNVMEGHRKITSETQQKITDFLQIVQTL